MSDKTFLEKLNGRCIGHPHFDSRVKSRSDTTIDYECFKLRHYAGDVCKYILPFSYNFVTMSSSVNFLLFFLSTYHIFACMLLEPPYTDPMMLQSLQNNWICKESEILNFASVNNWHSKTNVDAYKLWYHFLWKWERVCLLHQST